MEYFTQPVSNITKLLVGVKKYIINTKTKYQRLIIADLYEYGKSLILDDLIQITEVDEVYYHELLVHPCLITHPNPKKILIIGGGDGCALREVIKHPIEKVILVDIDGELVEICKEYFKDIHKNSFNDKRAEVIIMDGKEYVEKTNEVFDCIILDLTDPFGPEISKELYSSIFYNKIKKILKEDGIIVTQSGSAFYYKEIYESVYNNISQNFRIVREYSIWIPSFGYSCCFIIGSNIYDPSSLTISTIRERLRKRKIKNKFYNEYIHKSLFLHPVLK